MRKLNYLIHNVTVIDFVRIFKLARRYHYLSGLLVLASLIAIPVVYFKQPLIFQKEASFKILDANTLTNERAKEATLFAGQNNTAEVIGSIESYEFLQRLAERVTETPEMLELDFGSPLNNDSEWKARLLACKDKLCKITVLRQLLVQLYAVNPDGMGGRFKLKITTRSSRTTLVLLNLFEKTLEEVRIKAAAELARKQVANLEELIKKSKEEIGKKDGFAKVASAEFLDAMITQHKDKLRNLSSQLLRDDNQYYTQQVKLRESAAASESVKGKERLSYERFSKLQKRVEELRQNIASINLVPKEAQSQTDSLVLRQLQRELEASEKELATYGKMNRNIALDETFLDQQKGNKSSLEFNYRVSEAQVKKLRYQQEKAKQELDRLYAEKASLETELVALKPDLEYLKLLESRMVSLKFQKSSVTSDVMVDTYGTEVVSFKRNSIIKIVLFVASFAIFLGFIAIMVRYIFDDRIFEELEVEKCLADLPVVGHAPSFD